MGDEAAETAARRAEDHEAVTEDLITRGTAAVAALAGAAALGAAAGGVETAAVAGGLLVLVRLLSGGFTDAVRRLVLARTDAKYRAAHLEELRRSAKDEAERLRRRSAERQEEDA